MYNSNYDYRINPLVRWNLFVKFKTLDVRQNFRKTTKQ